MPPLYAPTLSHAPYGRCTTGQVRVRVIPSTACTRLPSSSRLCASARAMTPSGTCDGVAPDLAVSLNRSAIQSRTVPVV
jgi:hypothetical protein